MFIGRKKELAQLRDAVLVGEQRTAKLIACYGRRRIGKSELIREFGKNINNYIEIQGLAPSKGVTNQDQIDNFLSEFCRQTKLPRPSYNNWRDSFIFASKMIGQKKTLLFLDEISWMAGSDPKFTSILKQSYDTEFHTNKKLTIILCGSITSWISDNILNSTDFLGRINLDILLRELPLKDASCFFSKDTSPSEKLLFLLHSGGVPRYLKEYKKSISIPALVAQLSFKEGGLFYSEFERIFNDIFNTRASTYKDIVISLMDGPRTLSEIFSDLGIGPSGKYTKYMNDLILSGFVSAHDSWNFTASKKSTKSTRYRISDNYLRFYLKQIRPNIKKIKAGILNITSLDEIKNYSAFLGYQLENLVINNTQSLMELLKISSSELINFGPYYQKKTTRHDGCQIDYLIQTKSLFYIIEVKSQYKINSSVVDEVRRKEMALKIPPRYGLKKILIHTSEEELSTYIDEYFDRTICFFEFFNQQHFETIL